MVVFVVVGDGWCLVDGGRYVLCWLLCCVVVNPQISHGNFGVSCFCFCFHVCPQAFCCLFAEVPVLNWDVALRLGRFLPFESRSFTTIHTLFTSKFVVVNSGLLLRKRKLLLCWLTG